jgi:hypothetical protein
MSDGANAICWGTASGGSGIPCSTITAKGALITGTAPSTPTALGVGTNGQILIADSACATGLKWGPNTSGTVSAATPTVQGIVFGKQDCGTAYPDTAWNYSAYGIGAGEIFGQFNNANGTVALGNFSMQCGMACFQIAAGYCSAWCALAESCGVAIGYQAGAISCGVRTGGALEGQNVYVGSQAGCDACGGGNTLLGSQSGKFVTGECNTHVGYLSGTYFSALCSGAILCENVSVGVRTLSSLGTVASVTSTGNVAIGDEAGLTLQAGSYNIAIGWGSGVGSAAAAVNDNISIGRRAGLSLTTGSNNILLGCCAGTATGGVSGAITTASNRIVMGNSAHTCAQIQVAWTTTSDVRDKALDPAGVPYGLLFVEKLEPIAYRWCDRCTNEVTDEKLRYGFSAQNVRSLEGDDPVIVSDDNEEKLMITDQHLLPVLVNAIKELSERNRLLEERIAHLEDKL